MHHISHQSAKRKATGYWSSSYFKLSLGKELKYHWVKTPKYYNLKLQ